MSKIRPTCVKKTLNAGKGALPDYKDGTKAVFNYAAYRPIETVVSENGMPDSRDAYITVDDTKMQWPAGYGKPLELVFGKKFQLPVFETCLRSMLVDEVSQFDIEARELVTFPMVSKKLRDIVKPCDGHGHSHGHSTHMCAAALTQGTGYPELDELMKSPTPLRFVFHVLSVTPPEEYEAEGWQMTNTEKLASIEVLRQQGNQLYMEKDLNGAVQKYREALGRLDQLLLREKPGEPEWEELDKKNVSLFLNLSQCYLGLGEMYNAAETATEVLDREPTNEKALYRRARARIATWKLDEADVDLSRLLELHPHSEKLVTVERELLLRKREEQAKNNKTTSEKMLRALGN